MGAARLLARIALAGVAPLAITSDPVDARPAASTVRQEQAEQDVERWLELARTGAPHIRPQAAQRLLAAGESGAEVLRVAAGETTDDLAALGADLVEILARFGDEDLRARAWRATEDKDFPWRPSAVRSLAAEPRDGELSRFAALLADPVPGVRLAALGAFPEEASPAVFALFRAVLSDEDGRVRRAAAFELARRDQHWARLWLVEELERTDRWFEVDTGRLARFDAVRLLRRLGQDLGDYDPARSPLDPTNVEAIETARTAVEYTLEREPPTLPEVARAEDVAPPGVLGLELRSCRVGELYLQWGPGDLLFVGRGRPREVRLPEGALASLRPLVDQVRGELGDRAQFGTPGCDLEAWRLPTDDGGWRAVYLQKGPEPVPGLRPEPLDELARATLALLPPSETELAERLADSLEAVGGPLEAEGGE